MAIELFTNQSSTTVSSGGTTAPAPGTTESWTVASSATFPAAVTGTSQFHIAEDDPTKQSEIILVTNVSGTTWSVTRGVEGTTPVAHTTGFTVVQVVTNSYLSTAHTTAGVGRATSVVAETGYGLSTVVGTGTLWAPNDHSHGSPATPVTSIGVGARTGAVTLTAADVGAGTFPTGTFVMQAATSGVSLQVKAAATTPGNIQEWLLSSGTLVAKVDSSGGIWDGAVSQVFSPNNRNLATSVVDGTSYGLTSAVGTNTLYAHQDHSHGTTPYPLWKDPVRVASTAPLTIATSLVNGAVIDGITMATGDRVLVKDQSTQSENGIYIIAASGAASRASDADTAAKLWGLHVHALTGSSQGQTKFHNINTSLPTLGTTAITFAQDVLNVNGKTGVVALTAADIGTGTFPNGTYNFNGTNIQVQGGTGSIVMQGTLTAVGTVNGQTDMQFNGTSLPRGRVAGAQITANVTGIGLTATLVTGVACTFTYVTGRRYRAIVQLLLQQASASALAGTGEIDLRWAAGGSILITSTVLQAADFPFAATNSQKATLNINFEFTCVASGATGNQVNSGSNTLGITALMPTAASLVVAAATFPGQISIEDIGT